MRSPVQTTSLAAWCLGVFLASHAGAGAITAHVNKQLDYLNSGMPSSLEIGQDVNHTFVINQSTTGTPISNGIFYADAITDFEFEIPAVDFGFSGGHGDITHYNDGSLLLTGYAPYRVSLDGQRFASTEIFLIPKADTPRPIGSALQSLRSFEYDGFELSFYNPYSGGYSYGAVVSFGTDYDTVGGLYNSIITTPLTVSGGSVLVGVHPFDLQGNNIITTPENSSPSPATLTFDLQGNNIITTPLTVSGGTLSTVVSPLDLQVGSGPYLLSDVGILSLAADGVVALPEPSASILFILAIFSSVLRRSRSRR
ncbi:MAG: hypothetical protein AAGD22_00275 [Verrucomicrobiota bacterium]